MIESPMAELHWSKMPEMRDRNISRIKQNTYFEAFCFAFDAPKMLAPMLDPLVLHYCNDTWGRPKFWPAGTLYCPDCGEGLR